MSAHAKDSWISRDAKGRFLSSEWTVDHDEYDAMTWCEVQTVAGDTVAILVANSLSSAEMDQRSNLIAAAPDMLDALKDAILQIEYLHGKFKQTGSGNAALARIGAVIARATAP